MPLNYLLTTVVVAVCMKKDSTRHAGKICTVKFESTPTTGVPTCDVGVFPAHVDDAIL